MLNQSIGLGGCEEAWPLPIQNAALENSHRVGDSVRRSLAFAASTNHPSNRDKRHSRSNSTANCRRWSVSNASHIASARCNKSPVRCNRWCNDSATVTESPQIMAFLSGCFCTENAGVAGSSPALTTPQKPRKTSLLCGVFSCFVCHSSLSVASSGAAGEQVFLRHVRQFFNTGGD